MTAPFRYDEILEMLPAFALGALEADEMLAVEEYLRTQGTPDLLNRLEKLEDSAAVMAMQAPAQPLPVHLKGQLFDAIQADLAATEERLLSATPVPAVPKVTRPQPQRPVPLTESAWARWLNVLGGLLRPVAWAAVGAALAFVLLQTLNPVSQADLETARGDVQRLEGQLATLQTELQETQNDNLALQQINQTLQSQLVTSDQQLVVLAHTSQAIPLKGQESAPTASGALYVSQGQSLLVMSGLEVLPENQTYQLWLIPADGAAVPSVLLPVQRTGLDSLTVTLPDDATNYAAVGVSIEPTGGSDSPTGPIVLVGVIRS